MRNLTKSRIWGIRRTGFPPKIPPSFTEHLHVWVLFPACYDLQAKNVFRCSPENRVSLDAL